MSYNAEVTPELIYVLGSISYVCFLQLHYFHFYPPCQRFIKALNHNNCNDDCDDPNSLTLAKEQAAVNNRGKRSTASARVEKMAGLIPRGPPIVIPTLLSAWFSKESDLGHGNANHSTSFMGVRDDGQE